MIFDVSVSSFVEIPANPVVICYAKLDVSASIFSDNVAVVWSSLDASYVSLSILAVISDASSAFSVLTAVDNVLTESSMHAVV